MPDATPILIAAISGRALAVSARRAGYAPLVADCFGDQDTLAAAAAHVRLRAAGLAIDAEELLAALQALAADRHPAAVVYGTGFEDRPQLIARMATQWRVAGNDAPTVALLKDPVGFAALCRDCGIPHPETSLTRPPRTDGWLGKRAGGAGGRHIVLDVDRIAPGPGRYFQRRHAGRPVSALLLAVGRPARVVGFSEQWSAPAPNHPFRYGGAARPAALPTATADAMTAALARLAAAVPLVGLNSADFLVDGDAITLLEINPRPGASCDLFEPPGASLFALHLAACSGALPERPPALDAAAAGAIVYAERDVAHMPALAWPDWTADRPVPASSVGSDGPLCTVFAAARTAHEARHRVERRAARILVALDASLP